MPRMTDVPEEAQLVRALVIGFAKAGKSHWAAEAAAAGFNVIYLDGDRSGQTINHLGASHPDALKRVYYFDCHNTVGQPRFNRILHAMLTTNPLMWDDTAQRIWRRTANVPVDPTHTYWAIDFTKLTSNDVVVIDTWTQLVWSIMWDWALDHDVDLGDLEKASRDMYMGIGNRATSVIQTLRCLPCHLIVNAHPDEYIKKKTQKGKIGNQKEIDQVVEWSRMIPKSTSKTHGMTLAKEFNDVLWLEAGHLNKRTIDARTNPEREGGSIWSESKSTSEYSFANLVKVIGGAAPILQDHCAGITEYAPGEFDPTPPKGNNIIDAGASKVTPSQQAPKNSLAGLIKGR